MNYWQNRFKQLEIAQHETSLQKSKEVEEQFDRSLHAIDGKINAWYQRIAKNNNISMTEAKKLLSDKELKEFKWNVDDYIKYAKENEISGAWEKQLENASARVHISRLEALKIETQQELEKLYGNITDNIDKHIVNTYANDFYHTAYEVQKGIGVGNRLQRLNPDVVEKIVCKPWAVDEKNFSDRIWENKTKLINNMHNSLSRMCITGEPPDRAIKEIAKEMGVSKTQASRVVMTESAAFANKARQDCMVDLGVEEFEVVETLDSHTCGTCGDMDGKHYPMSEFQIGVTAPPFHPNCRGCTCPYFNDEFTQDEERAARGADGKTYYVPADTTYNEWKNSFVQGKKANVQPVQIITPQEEAANGQIELLKKYGNLTNIMLNGTSDDIDKWSELQNISSKTEKELLSEMSKRADNWETLLDMQSESTMKPFSNQLLDAATDAELSALSLWSGETYANINRYLRFGINVDDISKNAAKNIEAVLNRIKTSEEIIVHRGTGTKHIFEKMTGDWKSDPSVLVGQEFSDAGFVATSPLKEGGFSGIGESQAELFIKVPKGTHGAYIAHEAHNELEKEFLLQKGYSYRIIKAEYRNNPLFPDEKDLKIWCEVILNE